MKDSINPYKEEKEEEEEINIIRKRIYKKLSDRCKDNNGNLISGTFTLVGLFTPLEEAVYKSDMLRQTELLDHKLCPICRVPLKHKKNGILFHYRTFECPQCGFTASGL